MPRSDALLTAAMSQNSSNSLLYLLALLIGLTMLASLYPLIWLAGLLGLLLAWIWARCASKTLWRELWEAGIAFCLFSSGGALLSFFPGLNRWIGVPLAMIFGFAVASRFLAKQPKVASESETDIPRQESGLAKQSNVVSESESDAPPSEWQVQAEQNPPARSMQLLEPGQELSGNYGDDLLLQGGIALPPVDADTLCQSPDARWVLAQVWYERSLLMVRLDGDEPQMRQLAGFAWGVLLACDDTQAWFRAGEEIGCVALETLWARTDNNILQRYEGFWISDYHAYLDDWAKGEVLAAPGRRHRLIMGKPPLAQGPLLERWQQLSSSIYAVMLDGIDSGLRTRSLSDWQWSDDGRVLYGKAWRVDDPDGYPKPCYWGEASGWQMVK